MKRFLKVLLPLLVIIIALTAWVLLQQKSFGEPATTSSSQVLQENTDVLMIVKAPGQEDRIISQVFTSDQTVLDLLLSSNLSVEFEEYSFGNLVTSIDGVTNGTDNKYWVYYINSELAKVGASSYTLEPSDIITWQFEDEKEGI
jgi:hypothetical protein